MRNVSFEHAYHGYICGQMWMPSTLGWTEHSINLRSAQKRLSPHKGYADILERILTEKGGDFQNPLFPVDAVITITMIVTLPYSGRKHWASRSIAVKDIAPHLCSELASYEFASYELASYELAYAE